VEYTFTDRNGNVGRNNRTVVVQARPKEDAVPGFALVRFTLNQPLAVTLPQVVAIEDELADLISGIFPVIVQVYDPDDATTRKADSIDAGDRRRESSLARRDAAGTRSTVVLGARTSSNFGWMSAGKLTGAISAQLEATNNQLTSTNNATVSAVGAAVQEDSASNVGVIVGVVIAMLIVVAIVALLVVRRRRREANSKAPSQSTHGSGYEYGNPSYTGESGVSSSSGAVKMFEADYDTPRVVDREDIYNGDGEKLSPEIQALYARPQKKNKKGSGSGPNSGSALGNVAVMPLASDYATVADDDNYDTPRSFAATGQDAYDTPRGFAVIDGAQDTYDTPKVAPVNVSAQDTYDTPRELPVGQDTYDTPKAAAGGDGRAFLGEQGSPAVAAQDTYDTPRATAVAGTRAGPAQDEARRSTVYVKPMPADSNEGCLRYEGLQFYHDSINRLQTEALLTGKPAGTYLLRKVSSPQGDVVLSCVGGRRGFEHHVLARRGNGPATINKQPLPSACVTLEDILEHLSRAPTGLSHVLAMPLLVGTAATALLNAGGADASAPHDERGLSTGAEPARPWLHGLITREGAEQLLLASPATCDGAFLVRPRADGSFALSVVFHGKVSHHLITKSEGSAGWLFNTRAVPQEHVTLDAVISFLQTCPFDTLPIALSVAISKDTEA
jgi:hypothetical protein